VFHKTNSFMSFKNLLKPFAIIALTIVVFATASCKKEEAEDELTPEVKPEFKNRSVEPTLMSIFPEFRDKVSAYTLISSSDVVAGSPNFVFGGAPDGQGFIKNPDGSGYIMVTNHENTWALSRVYLDNQLNLTKGEYIVDTDGGQFRLCSASMATPAEHGFPNYVFLTTGESNVNAMTHAIDPIAPADPKNKNRVKPALGKFSGENAVPLSKNAYPGKTVIILGEDAGNGQVYLYISNTVGDLDNGKLYVLRRTDLNQIETAMQRGTTYDVEFVEVPNAKNLTGPDIENLNADLKSIQFARIEDLDYRKGSAKNNRELYFVATGVSGSSEKTFYGRVYQLIMNDTDPLKGKLQIIADGDNGELPVGKDIVNPDNLCATENYLYIQEDGDSFFPLAAHESYIWQYDFATRTKRPFITPTNRETSILGSKFNPNSDMRFGLWEWGAMIDISSEIGVPGTFLVNLHTHSWVEGDKYLNPSRATSIQSYRSGGQTLILTGVPR
jgi:secreted PhoX family phosphatase